MTVTSFKGGTVFDGPQATNFFRMMALLRGMKFELKTGMRLSTKSKSCFILVKQEFKLKGDKQKLIDQFEKLVEEENKKVKYVDQTNGEET